MSNPHANGTSAGTGQFVRQMKILIYKYSICIAVSVGCQHIYIGPRTIGMDPDFANLDCTKIKLALDDTVLCWSLMFALMEDSSIE